MRFLKVIFLFLIIHNSFSQDAPTVHTRLGNIKGQYLTSYQGRKFEAYEGVPYALPPTGDRRFEPPVPIKPWSGEWLANKKIECLQRIRIPAVENQYVIGDEDCLYLNVYTPIKKNNASLPVIIFIHGGAFQYGSSTKFGPQFLIDHNVVFVSIAYRLGVLGFLSTEDHVIPGNMGLKDQSLALRWVNENIDSFGGDPNKVTITGLSAGGASVHYHYLSPMSAGLFHSGISFSGTALNCWAQVEHLREKAIKLAELMDCPTNNFRDMVRCFKSRPGSDLVDAEKVFMPWNLNPFTPFGPVVERSTENAFIDRSPVEIINSGDVQDVPWITGVVSQEGLYPVAEFARKEEVLSDLDKNWEQIAPLFLDYQYTIPKSMQASVARKIRQHYFKNNPINKENLQSLIKLASDRFFVRDAEKAARMQAKANGNGVWFYYYSYRASASTSNEMSNSTENFGVSHGDDVRMVLHNNIINPSANPSDLEVHKMLLKFWINIAQKRIPNNGLKWQSVKSSEEYLSYIHIIGPNNWEIKQNSNLGEKHFWDSINFNENIIN